MIKILYEVGISYYNSGIKQSTLYQKEAHTLNELKESFLKRFGNITNAPNKALKERGLVKALTYSAKNITEWVELINTRTKWELNIKTI